jgi:hypothetical protein
MKHLILSISLLFVTTIGLIAQKKEHFDEGGGPRQKIKAIYIAYITQELNLNEEEAQKFWPVHAQFNQEMRSKHMQAIDELEKEESLLNVKKKYKDRFIKVIGEEKSNLFFKKDAEFRHKLSEKIKDNRKRRMGPPQ